MSVFIFTNTGDDKNKVTEKIKKIHRKEKPSSRRPFPPKRPMAATKNKNIFPREILLNATISFIRSIKQYTEMSRVYQQTRRRARARTHTHTKTQTQTHTHTHTQTHTHPPPPYARARALAHTPIHAYSVRTESPVEERFVKFERMVVNYLAN